MPTGQGTGPARPPAPSLVDPWDSLKCCGMSVAPLTKHAVRSKGICKAELWKADLASHRLFLNTKDEPGEVVLGLPLGPVGPRGFSATSAPLHRASLRPQTHGPPVCWVPALATLPTIVFPPNVRVRLVFQPDPNITLYFCPLPQEDPSQHSLDVKHRGL